MSSEDTTENVSEAILANCRRLIADAMLLLERGSAGSALALAIMALEEVGKGHQLELETTKGKSTPSWHHYRQFLASFVLMVSLFQKYGLPRPQFPDGIQQRIQERWAGKKGLRDIVGVPIPEDLRADVGGLIEPLLLKMDPDDLIVFRIELRWVNKVMMAAASGSLEAVRQSGLYLDHSDGIVGSDPANAVRQDAYRWIRVAERALLLLESGDFLAPYGELAGFLEARRPLPKGEELTRLLEELRVQPA